MVHLIPTSPFVNEFCICYSYECTIVLLFLKTVLIYFLEYVSTNDENSPFASACINITFEPCDNETCVDIGREVGIPLEDDTHYLNRLFNYTILNEKLVLGRPRYDRVIQDKSTGKIVVVDNDGMLPTYCDILEMHHAKNHGNKEIPLATLSRILTQSCVTPPYIYLGKGLRMIVLVSLIVLL